MHEIEVVPVCYKITKHESITRIVHVIALIKFLIY